MKYEYEIIQNFINVSGVCVSSLPSPVSACMSSVIVATCRVFILQYLLTGAWDMGPSVLEVPQNKKPCSLHFVVTASFAATAPLPSPSVVGCVCVCFASSRRAGINYKTKFEIICICASFAHFLRPNVSHIQPPHEELA